MAMAKLSVLVAWTALVFSWLSPAWATDKPPTPTPAQSQSQMQNQNAVAESSSVSGGGQASSNLYSGDTTRTVAIGTTAPAPLHATPQCYLPAKGIRRIRQAVFGVVTFDPRLVRDVECMQDVQAEREYELAKLEAETQLERVRTERIRSAIEAAGQSCAEHANRALEACAAK